MAVLVTAEQPPIPVTIVAADGVTPVPIPALGIEANTPPSGAATVAPAATATPPQVTTTTTTTAPVPVTVAKADNLTLTPTTTAADDKVTEGQRRVNLLWESSQSIISLAITLGVIYCQINSINSETLNNAFFFVVATYLQRTNHVRIGGVGNKPYEGR